MGFDEVVRGLRQSERQLQTQLEGVRAAISALEKGGPAALPIRRRGRLAKATAVRRKSASWSPAARRAVSLRMKKYWAVRRKASKAA